MNETAITTKEPQKQLVKNTVFETLMKEIEKNKKDEEEQRNKENIQWQKNTLEHEIAKEIASVYFFLIKQRMKIGRPISMKEFEATQKELIKIAENSWTSCLPYANWRYYLLHRYFRFKRTPFGSWHNLHPWSIKSYKKCTSDLDKFLSVHNINKGYLTSFPPNIKELIIAIIEKRQKEAK